MRTRIHVPLKRHAPIELSNQMAIKYSKKTNQRIINEARETHVYASSKQFTDLLFWSFFHLD
jgi:hypothetical protein